MKITLITPWPNAWIPYFKAEVERRGHSFELLQDWREMGHAPDVVIHGWASLDHGGPPVAGARNVYFLRRFELYSTIHTIEWANVDALIVVNSWIRERVKRMFAQRHLEVPVHLIYNGADPARWTYRDRAPGTAIGMACHVHPKKNLPLAAQILARLPEQYELHIAGAIQDQCTQMYLDHMSKVTRRRIYLYDHVDDLDSWWETQDYCLSTSLSEGNPNNVIEAMLKGIRPVVHHWPGAHTQFDPWVFRTANQAAHAIQHEDYQSARYRAHAMKTFGLDNIARAVDIALGEQTQENAA